MTLDSMFEKSIAPAVNWLPHIEESPDLRWRFNSSVYFTEGWDRAARASISIERYEVVRKTPKGAWITPTWWGRRAEQFVLDLDLERTEGLSVPPKRYAYERKIDAWNSFKQRLRWRRIHWQTEGARIHALRELVKLEDERNG